MKDRKKQQAPTSVPLTKYIDIRLRYTKTGKHRDTLSKVQTREDAFKYFIAAIDLDRINIQEMVYLMALNRDNRILAIHQLSIGGITGSLIDLRILCKILIDLLATSVILCHNHPSGNATASKGDRLVTEKIIRGLKLFNIILLDHLVITETDYSSVLDEDILSKQKTNTYAK